jgi:hypothetical protein
MVIYITIKGECLLALLDTGSMHNFIKGGTLQCLGLAVSGADQLRVTVANGDHLPCAGITRGVEVLIAGAPYTITCVGIDLGYFDFILGVDFLPTLGPITCDFDARTLVFHRDGRHVVWRAAPSLGSPWPASVVTAANAEWPMLDWLLQHHAAVFEELQGLPPARSYDHRIHLLSGTTPVGVRPYRYPQLQRDELERQVVVMLTQGIICLSTSPFSRPVLLVHKLDGSWRFCIDYHALNTRTSKDKFPIPVVDELLDELHGARYFTKLDLCLGYHQVHMFMGDIDKTTFRTHHGNYEFLVMPFGLSNAPAMFQALMNDVLRPYLRRSVLVFFDDILIYSSSWAEHLQHISIVLNELRAHQLQLKNLKCSFGASSVAYLGHIISEAGVSMDVDKVAAVSAWPQPRSARLRTRASKDRWMVAPWYDE